MRQTGKRHLSFLLFLFAICACLPLFSQTGTLTVNVIDETSGEALPGAVVRIKGDVEKTISAETGTAVFKNLPDGKYSVTVSSEGYREKTATINVDLSVKNSFSGTFKLKKGTKESATTASLTVTVLDAAESSLLDGADVTIEGPSPQNGSAQAGKIKFTGLADGSYKITVSSPGYETTSGKIMVSSADRSEYSGLFRIKRTGVVPAKKETKTESKPKTQPTVTKKAEPTNIPAEPVRKVNPPPLPKEEKKADAGKHTSEDRGQTSEEKPSLEGTQSKAFETLKIKLSWNTVLIVLSIVAGLIFCILLIATFARWGKSDKSGKTILLSGTLGCGCLTFIIIVVLIAIFFLHGRIKSSGGGKESSAQTTYPEYKEPVAKPELMSKTSHSAASAMLIESFNDPKSAEKKSNAISLLVQAVDENPGNDAYAVDLADTYVLCNDTYAVKVAADIYEDVLSRRPDDEAILARVAAA